MFPNSSRIFPPDSGNYSVGLLDAALPYWVHDTRRASVSSGAAALMEKEMTHPE